MMDARAQRMWGLEGRESELSDLVLLGLLTTEILKSEHEKATIEDGITNDLL